MFTTVPDKASGDVFTEAMWDTYIRDNLNKGVMRPLADTVLGSSAATIDFQSIPADFKHLRLLVSGRVDVASNFQNMLMRFNNVSTASYFYHFREHTGSTIIVDNAGAAATSARLGALLGSTASANYFGSIAIDLLDYTSATPNKAFVHSSYALANSGPGLQMLTNGGGVLASTAAINRITLLLASGNFITGTRATLYGMPS